MKEIKLNRGKIAQVDDEDYDYLNQWSWRLTRNNYGYLYADRIVMTKGVSKIEKMHRIIMKCTNPKIFIDHKDGNGLNNQKDNLRECTRSQNAANKHRIKGISKYLGVYRSLQNGICYWKAVCTKDRVVYQKYATLEGEAAILYNEMATMLHGEFANLNILTIQHLKEIEDRKYEKKCGRCKKYKLYGEFNNSRSTSTGLSSYCRSCLKLQWKKQDKLKARIKNKIATKKYRDKQKEKKYHQKAKVETI